MPRLPAVNGPDATRSPVDRNGRGEVGPLRLALCLLTLDEIDGLRALWDRIPFEACEEAFAVDGGSTDGTLAFFAEREFPVHLQDRRGRGEAFRQAFAVSDADAIVFFSPDGNEDPADIPRFRPHLEAGADIVIASRMMRAARNEEDGQVLRWRKWANQAFTFLALAAFGRGPVIADTINGFRGITRAAWEELDPDGHGHTIEYQTTIRALRRGLRIVEFPTREGPRIGGRVKARSIPTGLRFCRLLLRELARGTRPLHRPRNGSGRTERVS